MKSEVDYILAAAPAGVSADEVSQAQGELYPILQTVEQLAAAGKSYDDVIAAVKPMLDGFQAHMPWARIAVSLIYEDIKADFASSPASPAPAEPATEPVPAEQPAEEPAPAAGPPSFEEQVLGRGVGLGHLPSPFDAVARAVRAAQEATREYGISVLDYLPMPAPITRGSPPELPEDDPDYEELTSIFAPPSTDSVGVLVEYYLMVDEALTGRRSFSPAGRTWLEYQASAAYERAYSVIVNSIDREKAAFAGKNLVYQEYVRYMNEHGSSDALMAAGEIADNARRRTTEEAKKLLAEILRRWDIEGEGRAVSRLAPSIQSELESAINEAIDQAATAPVPPSASDFVPGAGSTRELLDLIEVAREGLGQRITSFFEDGVLNPEYAALLPVDSVHSSEYALGYRQINDVYGYKHFKFFTTQGAVPVWWNSMTLRKHEGPTRGLVKDALDELEDRVNSSPYSPELGTYVRQNIAELRDMVDRKLYEAARASMHGQDIWNSFFAYFNEWQIVNQMVYGAIFQTIQGVVGSLAGGVLRSLGAGGVETYERLYQASQAGLSDAALHGNYARFRAKYLLGEAANAQLRGSTLRYGERVWDPALKGSTQYGNQVRDWRYVQLDWWINKMRARGMLTEEEIMAKYQEMRAAAGLPAEQVYPTGHVEAFRPLRASDLEELLGASPSGLAGALDELPFLGFLAAGTESARTHLAQGATAGVVDMIPEELKKEFADEVRRITSEGTENGEDPAQQVISWLKDHGFDVDQAATQVVGDMLRDENYNPRPSITEICEDAYRDAESRADRPDAQAYVVSVLQMLDGILDSPLLTDDGDRQIVKDYINMIEENILSPLLVEATDGVG